MVIQRRTHNATELYQGIQSSFKDVIIQVDLGRGERLGVHGQGEKEEKRMGNKKGPAGGEEKKLNFNIGRYSNKPRTKKKKKNLYYKTPRSKKQMFCLTDTLIKIHYSTERLI